LRLLLPLTASLAAADAGPKQSCFDWQADNYAINQPLGGLIGVLLPALLLGGVLPAGAQQPISGYDYLTPEMQAMQDDAFGNPGMMAVEAGAELFQTTTANGNSCASCHGGRGAQPEVQRIARYPVYSTALKQPVTLRARVIACRNSRLGGPPLDYTSEAALHLESFVRHLARGETVNVDVSGALAPYYAAGEKPFRTRYGQVDVACHQCHDYHAGRQFRGQVLTQGQSNGFPAYRYTEGHMVGLQERFTECLSKLRAQPCAPGAEEYIALEVFMNARSNGLQIETPAIRY
jgi:sulfur-oxidizing protein SoxA